MVKKKTKKRQKGWEKEVRVCDERGGGEDGRKGERDAEGGLRKTPIE